MPVLDFLAHLDPVVSIVNNTMGIGAVLLAIYVTMGTNRGVAA
jgi:hypothetical protein